MDVEDIAPYVKILLVIILVGLIIGVIYLHFFVPNVPGTPPQPAIEPHMSP